MTNRINSPRLRSLRKHRVALIALAAYHFAFFFPTLFMHRVVSPNDVFFNFEPWSAVRTVDVQNSLLNDPPTSYFTLMSLAKSDWHAFHWNPFVASGIPGFGSSASAVLSPFILLPTLVLPLSWVYTGIIFLKLNVAFWFAYLWLREERMGKGAAAVGAIILAASGTMAVRWLWQTTNAAALYPALLWIVRRVANGKRTPFWILASIALFYALAGFPAAMAYGAWIAGAYLLVLGIIKRTVPPAIVAAVLALLIAAPSLVPMLQFVRRSGYLEARSNAAIENVFPLRHFVLFVSPDHLGNKAYKNWNGDRALGVLNNYVEATVYLGLISIPLVVFALPNRRAKTRWFWFGAAAVILACMFGFRPIAGVVGALPGFKYSPLTRLQIIMPIPAAYLAAAGAGWVARRKRLLIASAIAVIAAGDLAVFAGRFYPYLEPSLAMPPVTPTIAYLQSQPKPFRIAPFFIYLWPNTSELYRLEDIRSHFSSEAKYRQLLNRVDPTSFANNSTVITFNSLHFDFADPLMAMLGVRYYLENRDIEIIKWTTFKYTVPGHDAVTILPGATIERRVPIDAEPFYAIELPVNIEQQSGVNPRMVVSLLRGNRALFSRAFTPADMNSLNKMYIPVRPFARLGDAVMLRVQSVGIRANLVLYGRVTVPVIFDRQLPDGRLFLNTAEVPRFHTVTRLRKMSESEFLATKDIDFSREAVVTAGDGGGAPLSDAVVTLGSYAEAEQRIEVRSAGPAFLASSEKLTPELRVIVDGREVRPVEINMLFAGVPVPAGTHQVIFSRRIGRGWWWASAVAAIACIALSIIDVVRR
jgi:hypothetical protein